MTSRSFCACGHWLLMVLAASSFSQIAALAQGPDGNDARNEKVINLSETTSLSDEEAAELSARPWEELYLNRVEFLSDAALAHLAKHDGKIVLSGLKNISSRAAEILATHKGILVLELEAPSDEVLGSLAMFKGDLYLNGFARLSTAAAESLGTLHEGELGLNDVAELAVEQARSLAKHKGILRLKGVRGLTPAVASELAKSEYGVTLADNADLTQEVRAALSQSYGGSSLDHVSLPAYFATNPLWRREHDEGSVRQAVVAALGGELPSEDQTRLGGVTLGTPFRELRHPKERQPKVFSECFSCFMAHLPLLPEERQNSPVFIRVDSLTGRVVGVMKYLPETTMEEVVGSLGERFGQTDQEIEENVSDFGTQATAQTVIRYTFRDVIARVSAQRTIFRSNGKTIHSVLITILDRAWVEDCLMSYGYAVAAGCDWATAAIRCFDGRAFRVAGIDPLPGTERMSNAKGTHGFFVDSDRMKWFANAKNFRAGQFLERAKRLMPSPIVAAVGVIPDPDRPESQLAVVVLRAQRSSSTGMRRLMTIDNYNGENDISDTPARDLLRAVGNAVAQEHFEPATDKISVIRRQAAEEAIFEQPFDSERSALVVSQIFQESRGGRYEWRTQDGWTVCVGFDGSVYLSKRPQKSID